MPTNSPPSTPRSFSPCSPWSTRTPSLPLWRTICSSTSPLSPSLSIPSRSPLKTFLIVFRISLLSSLVVSTLLDKQPEDLSLQLVPVYGFLTNTSPILCSIVFTRYSTSSAAISVATTIPTFLIPPSQTGNTKSKDRVSLLFYLLRFFEISLTFRLFCFVYCLSHKHTPRPTTVSCTVPHSVPSPQKCNHSPLRDLCIPAVPERPPYLPRHSPCPNRTPQALKTQDLDSYDYLSSIAFAVADSVSCVICRSTSDWLNETFFQYVPKSFLTSFFEIIFELFFLDLHDSSRCHRLRL